MQKRKEGEGGKQQKEVLLSRTAPFPYLPYNPYLVPQRERERKREKEKEREREREREREQAIPLYTTLLLF